MELLSYIRRNIATAPSLSRLYTQRDGVDLPKRRFYFALEKRCRRFIEGDMMSKSVVLPGLRGTGKTTALLQLYRYLTENLKIPRERVLYINLEEVAQMLGSSLYEVVEVYLQEILESYPENLKEHVFLLVDEAHFDKKWQVGVKLLHDRSQKTFIAVTGSSSIALEITPDLVRRVVRENVYPLSFSEYVLLKHEIYKPRDTCQILRDAIFRGRFDGLNTLYNRLLLRLSEKLPTSPEVEFKKYLRIGGFAFGLETEDEKEVHRRVMEMVEKIIRVDMPTVVNMTTETIPYVFKIIIFMALQSPGGISIRKIEDRLNIKKDTAAKILDALEKTRLIFKVIPLNGAGAQMRKPWKFYFATPTLNYAIIDFLGKYESPELTGTVLETLVAGYLRRTVDVLRLPYGIFYEYTKKAVDLIIEDAASGERIPVEVTASIRGEDIRRVRRAMQTYSSPHGIIVTMKGELQIKERIAVLPAMLFSFL